MPPSEEPDEEDKFAAQLVNRVEGGFLILLKELKREYPQHGGVILPYLAAMASYCAMEACESTEQQFAMAERIEEATVSIGKKIEILRARRANKGGNHGTH